MIKPGTMCMVRGLVKYSEANGMIVKVTKYLGNYIVDNEFKKAVHCFEPDIKLNGRVYNKSQEKFLFPLDPCEDDLAKETLERLDEQMQETFINTVMEKLNG